MTNKKLSRLFKAFLIIMMCVGFLFISGCNVNEEIIISDFHAIISQPATIANIEILKEYVDKNIGKISAEKADEMACKYANYLEMYVPERSFTEEELEKYGYLKWEVEGMTDYMVDYDVLIDQYGRYVSDAMIEFFELRQTESLSPLAADAALLISWNDLIERVYQVEVFAKKYKDNQIIYNDIKWIYETYVHVLLDGMDNSPVFDYNDGKFLDEVLTAYSSFANTHQDTVLAWTINEYFTFLNSIDYTLNLSDESAKKTQNDTVSWLVSEAGKRVFE